MWNLEGAILPFFSSLWGKVGKLLPLLQWTPTWCAFSKWTSRNINEAFSCSCVNGCPNANSELGPLSSLRDEEGNGDDEPLLLNYFSIMIYFVLWGARGDGKKKTGPERLKKFVALHNDHLEKLGQRLSVISTLGPIPTITVVPSRKITNNSFHYPFLWCWE